MIKKLIVKLSDISKKYSPLALAVVAFLSVIAAFLSKDDIIAWQRATFGLVALTCSYVASMEIKLYETGV